MNQITRAVIQRYCEATGRDRDSFTRTFVSLSADIQTRSIKEMVRRMKRYAFRSNPLANRKM